MVKTITGQCPAGIVARQLPCSAALTGSSIDLGSPPTNRVLSSGLQTQSQIGHPQQIICPRHEIGPSLCPFYSTIPAASQSAYRFHPAKNLLDPFAQALADAVTCTASRPAIQSRNVNPLSLHAVCSEERPAPGTRPRISFDDTLCPRRGS